MTTRKSARPVRKRAIGVKKAAHRPRRSRRKLTPIEHARALFASNHRKLNGPSGELTPPDRNPPFVVLGTADVGQLHFCDAKATYAQTDMESAFAARMHGIIRTNDKPPSFVRPEPEVLGLEVLPPDLADLVKRQTFADSADYEVAESEIAIGTWHVGYAAAFNGLALGLPSDATVYLAGILDGAREDGTVLEVRKTSWNFDGILKQNVNLEKEVQANIYAVMLGMPRWECAFSCKDGIFRTTGTADRERAIADVGAAARFRWGIDQVRGVEKTTLWKCRSRKRECDFLDRCAVTPLRINLAATQQRDLSNW